MNMKIEESGYIIYNEDETRAIFQGRYGPVLTKDFAKITIYKDKVNAERDLRYYNRKHDRKVTLHIKPQSRKVMVY